MLVGIALEHGNFCIDQAVNEKCNQKPYLLLNKSLGGRKMSIVDEFNLEKIEESSVYEIYEGEYSSDEEIERKLKLAGYKFIGQEEKIYLTRYFADDLELRIAILDSGNIRIWDFASKEYYDQELELYKNNIQ